MTATKSIFARIAIVGLLLCLGPICAEQRADLKLPTEFAGYSKWTELLKSPHPVPLEMYLRCVAPTPDDWAAVRKKYGPHAELYIQVYANQVGASALSNRARQPFPVGTVIAKEKRSLSAERVREGVAFMVKREKSEFPTTAGWEFRYYPATADQSKAQAACSTCHRAAASNDWIFGQYPR